MTSQRTFNVSVNGNDYSIEIKTIEDGQATVEVNGAVYDVSYE